MAVKNIDTLRHELPELFNEKPLPPQWPADWGFIRAKAGEKALPTAFDDLQGMLIPESYGNLTEGFPTDTSQELIDEAKVAPQPWLPPVTDRFPGAPQQNWPADRYPPPNALAFYLPFHYYHCQTPPSWWGVYVTIEGFSQLSQFLWHNASPQLTKPDALRASQFFLYGQKVYHHLVECFATRLEITHRIPLYRAGFARFYEHDKAKTEDILATVHGYEVATRAFRRDKPTQHAVANALRIYIQGCPPPYQHAVSFITPRFQRGRFKQAECHFAEENHSEALPDHPRKHALIWRTFLHALSGISRITSEVNYIIHRDSPLYQRLALRI